MAVDSSFNSMQVALDSDWWTRDDPGPAMSALVREIRQNQADEKDTYETCLTLCMDSPGATINPSYRADSWDTIGYEPLSLNITEMISATIIAELTTSKVRPMFLTTGGDWSLRRRTKDANRWIDGLFADTRFYSKVYPACVANMVRFGTGIAKFYIEHGKLKTRRVLPWSMVVDKVEGRDQTPPAIYEQQYLDRRHAAALYPEHREYILKQAPGPTDEWALLTSTAADVVLATEGYRLSVGDGDDGEKGRHTIAIGDVTVFDEEWDEDWYPYAFCRYSDRPFGMWGRGVPEQLVGIQYNVNKTAMVIDQCHENAPVSIWIQRGSKIIKSHIQNGIGTIGEYDLTPPTVLAPQMVSSDMYAWLERQYQRGFERVGASQLSARAELPAGLRNASGVALQSYVDQTNKRFTEPHQNAEQFVCDCAEIVVKLVKREGINVEARHAEKGQIKALKWSDISLEPPYSVSCWPVGLLPSTPAGKLQTIQEVFVQGGLAQAIGMTPQMICQLLGAPDLESATKLLTAGQDNLERVLDTIVEEKRYITPDATWNVVLGLTLGVLKSQELLCDGLGEDSEEIGLLREWIVDCDAIIEGEKQKLAPPPPVPGSPEAPALPQTPAPLPVPPSPGVGAGG